jgi:hypothetical protein
MDPKRFWRRIGAIALAGAMLMLLAGLTILDGRLGPAAFLAYWAACFAFTTVAMLAAFMDLRRIRLQSRDQHRKLLESAITSIEEEAKKKRSNRPPNHGTGKKSPDAPSN